MQSPVIGTLLILVLTSMYISFSTHRHTSRCKRKRTRGRRTANRCASPIPEDFEPEATPVGPRATSQADIDFSDVLISESMRADTTRTEADAAQMQSVNERFRAAKRAVMENKLKTGVYTNKQRRKLVETLLRRAGGACGRRVRCWRTENSDFLRGDVRPKQNQSSSNIVRSAKNNPDIDLHPGALGPMAGLQGRWLMEENIPGNLFVDAEMVYG